MCSSDRKELEALKSKLFRTGIRSEICSNPIADALGITRLEINVYDSDFIEASRIHQDFLAERNGEGVPNRAERSSAGGRASGEEVEVVVEPEPLPSDEVQFTTPSRPERGQGVQQEGSSGDLAQAAVLLEKEIEAVLTRDHELARECAALRDQANALRESLTEAQAKLARESSDRVAVEQQLAEAASARGSMEKELASTNVRLKTAEQSLATAQGKLESQTRELNLQQTKLGELNKEVASRESRLGALDDSLAQARAALENEKRLRQAADQKAGEHAAARKSLEQQVDHFTKSHAQLQEQNQRERVQIQAYLDTVNKLRGRLSEKRTER